MSFELLKKLLKIWTGTWKKTVANFLIAYLVVFFLTGSKMCDEWHMWSMCAQGTEKRECKILRKK